MNIVNYLLPNPHLIGNQDGKRVFGKDITNISKPNQVNKSKKITVHSEQLKINKQIPSKIQQKDAINDYHEDIFDYISSFPEKKVEMESTDTQINEKMRSILIDWLVDVHQSFSLRQQTLFLAYRYLDQYQNCNLIKKEQYQLVGITCLWIASKYEEIYPPRMRDFVQVTANTYTASQLKKMEAAIIAFLKFNLNRITPLSLLTTLELQQFGNAENKKHLSLAKYVIELSYMNGNIMRKYDIKTVVIASIKLSEAVFKKQINIGYFICQLNNSNFHACYKQMCLLLQGENKYKLTAMKRKYQKQKYNCVGKISIKSNS